MRGLKAILAVAMAVLALSSCATPSSVREMEWVAALPRGMWVIEVGPSAKAIPCSPAICQAGINLSPYLVVVQYSKSQAGRAVRLSGRVEGCGQMFRRSLDLEGLDEALWQARYGQLFGEMVPSLRKGCSVAAPDRLAPIELRRLILEDES